MFVWCKGMNLNEIFKRKWCSHVDCTILCLCVGKRLLLNHLYAVLDNETLEVLTDLLTSEVEDG